MITEIADMKIIDVSENRITNETIATINATIFFHYTNFAGRAEQGDLYFMIHEFPNSDTLSIVSLLIDERTKWYFDHLFNAARNSAIEMDSFTSEILYLQEEAANIINGINLVNIINFECGFVATTCAGGKVYKAVFDICSPDPEVQTPLEKGITCLYDISAGAMYFSSNDQGKIKNIAKCFKISEDTVMYSMKHSVINGIKEAKIPSDPFEKQEVTEYYERFV